MKTEHFILAILFMSVFAAVFAIAEGEISDVSQASQTTTIAQDVASAVNEADKTMPDNDTKTISFKAVILGDGWGVASDNLQAEFLRVFWVLKTHLEVDQSLVQQIVQKYGNDQVKLREELKKLSTTTNTKAFGKIYAGFGGSSESYNLAKKEITENSSSFYILPVEEGYPANEEDAGKKSIGTLEINKHQYTDLALWSGVLKLISGKYAGEWKVDVASKTSSIKESAQGQVNNKTANKSEKKKSFWQKLMFWKKD